MGEEPKITMIAADDHPIVINGIERLIEGRNFSLVAKAGDGEAALEAILTHKPDLAILDILMPGKTGLDIAKIVQKKKLKVKIIILTGIMENEWCQTAFDAGVAGLILKENTGDELLSAIHHVMRGVRYVSPIIGSALINRQNAIHARNHVRFLLESLTPMEKKVLSLVADNRSSRDIAEALYISEKTVSHHRANMSRKLEVSGPNGLLHFALRHRSMILDSAV